jgi:CRP-like cAMP-binding protein
MSEPITGNKLLEALPPEELQRLRPHVERVRAAFKQTLYEPDTPIEHVYFPVDLVASIIHIMQDGTIVETATVGNEGMVGLPVFLGVDAVPEAAFCQIPGDAWRMRSDALRERVAERGGRLHELLHRYAQAMIVFTSQGTACAQTHSIRQRASRWLLHTHDRVASDEFPITQEFLSQMLGVRRAGVSEVARALQGEGLIAYSRGRMTVRDREGLEAASCECYGVIRREFNRLIG